MCFTLFIGAQKWIVLVRTKGSVSNLDCDVLFISLNEASYAEFGLHTLDCQSRFLVNAGGNLLKDNPQHVFIEAANNAFI